MRKLALVTVTILAACSGGGDQESENKAVPETNQLTPGLWEMTTQVSGIDMAYKDVKAPDASKMSTTFRTCITEEQAKQPPAEAFAGKADGKSNCKYDNFYMSRGRINASMICQPGNQAMNIDGQYTADSMDMTMELSTYQGTADDMKMSAKLSGRRISESCPAEGETEPKAG